MKILNNGSDDAFSAKLWANESGVKCRPIADSLKKWKSLVKSSQTPNTNVSIVFYIIII